MRHQNYSTPQLPTQRASYPDAYADQVPPLPPPYEAAGLLEGFNNMHLGDNIARGTSAMSMRPSDSMRPNDPIPRAGTSMSVRPTQPLQHIPARSHLPVAPDQAIRRMPPGRPNDQMRAFDASSVHSGGSGGSVYNSAYSDVHDGSVETDATRPASRLCSTSPGANFNTFYAAASDVLGMGPPPGAAPPSHMSPQQGPPDASTAHYYAENGAGPLPPSQSAPYLGPGPYQPGAPSVYSGSSQTSLVRGPSDASAMLGGDNNDDVEFERRPALQRSGTTASVVLRTQKTKAQYIDEYRTRIKDDPDPEAHFLYAKYLIDAAKKIGADAKDQRGSLKVMRRWRRKFFLANCHGTGMLGLPVDHERAYHLYLQAAKQNHAAACYRVAVCNEIGAGTRREPQRALAFYRKPPAGDARGAANPREAVGWLKRAAEQADEENPHALHELAILYETPNPQFVPFDPAYAKELYTRAGHLGYTHSQYKLGQCFEYGSLTCPLDPRRSIAWYTKAAEKGHSEAELALSGWYLTGSEGVLKQSDSEAYLWARRAANKGLSKAEYAVGYYAEVGIGIKQDIEFAKRYYMRAAAQGNKRAMNRLTEMKRTGNKRANMARPTRQEAKDECVIV
ncbi:hypothetical protein B0H21DRAFT_776130 [Amylocystis lapponica]|nr:hypothetical protein B0H21DRAFT_776130 [Amylocystis lapponica]